jgi:hypothetical protein
MTMIMFWNGVNTKDVPAAYGSNIKANTRAVPIPLTNPSDADKL